jgi:penicillin amidase
MRRKILKRGLIAITLLMLFLTLTVYLVLRASLPTTSGKDWKYPPGMSVLFYFDELARPYVDAAFPDAFEAQGWLHANNRLWQMEMFRRAGKGRLAELLGPGMLEADQELWRMGVPQLAKKLEENASDRMRRYVDAYVWGANRAIGDFTFMPPEFLLLQHTPSEWTPKDVFAVGALMAFQSGNNAENELLRLALFDKLGPNRANIFLPSDGNDLDFPYIMPATQSNVADLDLFRATNPLDNTRFPSFAFGSNGWVVAPSRAEEGHALFAFDSHDALGLPNLFYEIHINEPPFEQLHGWSVPGLPGVINGYNAHIAWGFTNIGDTQDLFLETRHPDDPLKFRDGDAWYTARTETVEIPVAGRDTPEQLTITHTRNGTLISEDPPIALRWTIQDLGEKGLDSLIDINFATNWEEFNEALDGFAAPALNATYADTKGNIGFRTAGILPIRGKGEGLVPLPGDDPANRWHGFVAPEDMPRRFNPPEGFLAAANARVNPDGDGPLVSADNAPGYRIRRIHDVLGGTGKLSREDMAALQMDWYDQQAALLLPAMLRDLDASDLPPTAEAAREALRAWQKSYEATPVSGAALLFQAWYPALARAVFTPALGEELAARLMKHNYPLNHALDRLILKEPESPWWQDNRPGILRDSFLAAVEEIAAVQGEDVSKWRLDRIHAVKLEHELGKAVPQLGWFFNTKSYPWGGAATTVGRARYRYDRGYDVTAAATVRVVGVMHPDGPRMSAIMPGGQSGHPLSPHYADQFPMWLNGELVPIQTELPTGKADMVWNMLDEWDS